MWYTRVRVGRGGKAPLLLDPRLELSGKPHLAHGFVADLLDVTQFHQVMSQPPQRPPSRAVRSRTTDQRDQGGFLRAVQPTATHSLHRSGQDRLQHPTLRTAFAHALDRTGAHFQRFLDPAIAPSRSLWTLIGFQQHAGVGQLACRGFSRRDQVRQLLALCCRQFHDLLFHRGLLEVGCDSPQEDPLLLVILVLTED